MGLGKKVDLKSINDVYSSLILAHIQWHIILKCCYRTEICKLARKKITTSALHPPPSLPFLFPLPPPSSLPPPISLWLTFTHHLNYFSPACCQATGRKSITWRRQNHRKSLQGDTSRRRSMKEPGSLSVDKNTFFLLSLSTVP